MTEENTLKNEGLKVYEVGYLLLPNIEESKIQEESSKIRDIIEDNKGMFVSDGVPEMKALTYPMTKAISGEKQKFNNAYFGWIKFEAGSGVIDLVKQEFEKIENILRFLIIKTIKENITVAKAKAKAGKFAFDKKEEKSEKTEEKEVEEKTEKVEEVENKEIKEKKEEDKKELDSTIDELVIE